MGGVEVYKAGQVTFDVAGVPDRPDLMNHSV
jgi:hypothetical protein